MHESGTTTADIMMSMRSQNNSTHETQWFKACRNQPLTAKLGKYF
jgi:hypothetical protein